MNLPAAEISHYRLTRRIGHGGMGEVFEAVDDRIGRTVAVKLLRPELASTTERQARFLREARAAGALNHPGVITVHDVGLWEGRLYLVMERVDGEALDRVAQRGVAPALAFEYIAQAADALAVAHAQGILHRDVKTENLMLTRDGRVKVLDFGLAKWLGEPPDEPQPEPPDELPPDDLPLRHTISTVAEIPHARVAAPTAATVEVELPRAAATPVLPRPPTTGRSQLPPAPALTRAGTLLGTPGCMSPEQTQGRPVDPPSEVFSLGVALYELLTRRRPFDRSNLHDTLEATRTETPARPSETPRGKSVTPAMDAVAMRALAVDPAGRYPDMKLFAAALRAAARPRERRIRPAWLAAAALLIAAAGGFGALALRGRRGGAHGPQPVVRESRRLTFDPGCEEDPVFTPDGKTVIYDGLVGGDYELLALDLERNVSAQLTRSPSWDYAPVVSPDGRRIAYMHLGDDDEEVHVIPVSGDAGAPPVHLARSWALPAWNARGEVLTSEEGLLVAWSTDAQPRRRIVAHLPAGLRATQLAPFPDGEVIAALGTFRADVTPALWRIVDGGVPARLPVPAVEPYGLIAAPNGRGFYHLRATPAGSDELVWRPRDGRGEAVVRGGVAPTGGFAIATGGKRMVYSSCKPTTLVARLGAPGEAPEMLGGHETGWIESYPAALGQDRVVFTSNRAGAEQVWQLELGSGRTRALTPRGTYHGVPSPDGVWLAFSDRATPGVHVVQDSGGAARRLTDDVTDTPVGFSHDAAQLVFLRTGPAGDRLWSVPAAGGAPRQLIDTPVTVAAVSPVEDRIVYLAQQDDHMVLMASDLAGTTPVTVGPQLGLGFYDGLRFARDGRHVLVIRRQVDALEIALDAAAPPALRWHASTQGLDAIDYAPDGRGLIATVTTWDGDLWLAEGDFP